MSIRRSKFRALVAPVVLVAGGVTAVACTPPPACPTLVGGDWSGTWSSAPFAGAGGTIDGTFVVDGASLSGDLAVSGTVVVTSGPISGTIDCDRVSGARTDGTVAFDGTIAPDGRSVTGSYTAPGIGDTGSITLTKD
jgi:hypothetical protein